MLLSYDEIFKAVRKNIRRGYWRSLQQQARNASFAQLYSSQPSPIMIGRRHPTHGQMYLIDGQARLAAALMGTGITLPEPGEPLSPQVIEYLESAGIEVTDPGDTRENWSRAMEALFQAFRVRDRERREIDLREIRPQGQSLQNPCAEIRLDTVSESNLDQPDPAVEQEFVDAARNGEVTLSGSPFSQFIAPEQHKFVAAALFLWMEGTTNHQVTVDRDIVLKLCRRPPNKRQRKIWAGKTISVAAGNLVNCFYSGRYPVQWWAQYRQMVGYMMRSSPIDRNVAIDSFCIYFSGLLYDAIGLGKQKMPHTWRTEPVIGILKGMKADIALDRGPILADALQDAGCDKEDLLNHLRTGPISLGSWLFRSTGIM